MSYVFCTCSYFLVSLIVSSVQLAWLQCPTCVIKIAGRDLREQPYLINNGWKRPYFFTFVFPALSCLCYSFEHFRLVSICFRSAPIFFETNTREWGNYFRQTNTDSVTPIQSTNLVIVKKDFHLFYCWFMNRMIRACSTN